MNKLAKPLADKLYISTICLLLLISCGKREYKGYVYDKERHIPLKDVLVKHNGQQVKSDKNGYFVIEDNGEVSDDITFSKKGYTPDTARTIVIRSSETMSERFRSGHDTIFLLPIPKVQLQNNERDLSKSATIKWPITSQQFQKFYKKNPQTREYTLVVPSGYDLKIYADTGTHFQESPFGYEIKPGGRYLTAAKFKLSGTDCKIIIYNLIGENDSPVLNIQLNSYDKEGQLQDVLLLDSRFIFEVEYYRDFRIEESGIIKQKLHQIEHYTYNEQGDITGNIEDPQVQTLLSTYKIQADGKFRKLDL